MNLAGLALGSLTLTPSFDGNVTSYTATTTNATNSVTATAVDPSATVTIKFGGDDYESGDSLTWEEGENIVEVVVSKGGQSKTYTITVTK